MPKKRYILFIKRLPDKNELGWYGIRGIFPSIKVAQEKIAQLCNKNSNFAEIVEMDTLKVVATLRKGADNVWR